MPSSNFRHVYFKYVLNSSTLTLFEKEIFINNVLEKTLEYVTYLSMNLVYLLVCFVEELLKI